MKEIQEKQFPSLGQKDTLEKEMATHSSILARKIPWTEESGRLQFMGPQRVGHDRATRHTWTHVCTHGHMCTHKPGPKKPCLTQICTQDTDEMSILMKTGRHTWLQIRK